MKFTAKRTSNDESLNTVGTRMMLEMTADEDTTTIKRVSALTGSKAEKSEIIALAIASGKQLSERADKTFIFPSRFVVENFDRFGELITIMNRNTAYEIGVLRGHLTDEQKGQGKQIAIYRKARQMALDLLSNTATTMDNVAKYMDVNGFSVDGQLKYNSDVKMGRKTKDFEHGLQKRKEIDGRNWWVMSVDVYGASAIPVYTDGMRNIAVQFMIDLEERYEKGMKSWVSDSNRSFETLLEVMEAIWPVDINQRDVISFELSDTDIIQARNIAEKVARGMRNVQ